tara:strand:+ start:732 stop:989 length:258 start_codon:yes stop_codon:yes gene_type:complete
MAEYKIVKTVAALAKSQAARVGEKPSDEVYEIYRKVLWFWVYVDYEYSEDAAVRNVDRKLGRSPTQLATEEAKKQIPEEIGRYKG